MCRHTFPGCFSFNVVPKGWMVIAAILLTPVFLPAQADEERGQVFELDPFVVSENDRDSYLTTSTIGATRISTPLQELPMQIGILSEAFLRDTASFDLIEAVNYLPGIEEARTERGNTFFIRGFESDTAMRNGVRTFTPPSSAIVSRIELIKGPAALLYGQTSPGGVLNYVTKKPLWTKVDELEFSVGSYDFLRGQFSHNRVIDEEKLAYRVDVEYAQEGSFRHLAGSVDKKLTIAPIVEWKPLPGTRVEFTLEYLDYQRIQARRNIGEDPRFPDSDPRPGTELFPMDYVGDPPNAWRDETSVTSHLQVTHQISDWLTVRLNGVYVDRQIDQMRTGNSPLRSPLGNQDAAAVGFKITESVAFLTNLGNELYPNLGQNEIINTPEAVGFRFPNYINLNEDNERYNIQVDVLFDFETGPFKHALLLGVEVLRDEEIQPQKRLHYWEQLGLAPDGSDPDDVFNPRTASGSNLKGEVLYGREHSIGSMTFRGWNVPLLGTENAIDVGRFWVERIDNGEAVWLDVNRGYAELEADALYFSDQITFNDNRGRIMLGLRYDDLYDVNTEQQIPGTESDAEWQANLERGWVDYAESSTTEFSPMAGISYAFWEGVNFFAGYSESVSPQRTPGNANVDQGFPAKEGIGLEAGAKFLLFDDRFSLTASVFEITRTNLAFADPADNNPDDGQDYIFVGEQESRGVDLELYLQLIEGWEIKGAYTFIDTEVLSVSDENTAADVGGPMPNTREHTANMWMRYNFNDGILEGLGMGLGWRYGSKVLLSSRGYPLPSYSIMDAALYYKWEMKGMDWSARLNVKNLTEERYLTISRVFNDPTEVFLTLSTSF